MVKKKARGGGDKHNGFPSLKFSKSYLAVKNFFNIDLVLNVCGESTSDNSIINRRKIIRS